MWSHLSLFLIVGVAVSYCDQHRFADENHDYGWSKNKEYKYTVRSTTMTNLDDPHHEATGITMKGILTIQAMTPNTLYGTLRELQYAHKEEIRPTIQPREDSQEEDETYHNVPISGKSFQINNKNGMIQEMTVEREVPFWEVNILKSFMSQLQVDLSGQNIIPSKYNQMPEDAQQPFSSYKVMEDSVAGNCEVFYDILPLDEDVVTNSPELMPRPSFDGGFDGRNFIEIRKTKDYKNCKQRHNYIYNQTNERLSWPYTKTPSDTSVSQISTTRMIISGNLRKFTTQSSVTHSTIFIKSDRKDRIIGNVRSMINLTLVEVNDKPVGQKAEAMVPTGNLMYMNTNPFAESHTQPHLIAREFHQIQSSDRSRLKETLRSDFFNSNSNSDSSSSEENISPYRNPLHTEFIPPRLIEVPYNSFMPLFIGLSGKNSSEGFIAPEVLAANLIMRVTKALEDPTVFKSDEMIETFMLLQDLLRTMNNDQLTEVERHALKSSDDSTRDTVQKIIYKTIAQIGTGPSLIMFTNWIKNQAFTDVDAAVLVARIPKTVRALTSEYLKHFHEMISTPETMDKDVFNVSAPIAFAELIRSAQERKRYSPNSLGYVTDEDLETYISYFAKQLKEAIEKNDRQRVHTYIVALSYTGHPKILSVFEPYLEGKQAITKCQRTMMVTGLSSLARIYPALARSVLSKIYMNTREDDEIRVAAFYSLIRTDPPLVTYMRMAQFTNFDRSPQVNSAVSTTIKSLASLKQARAQNIAIKARIARELLKRNYVHSLNSIAYYADTDNEDSILRSFHVETMGRAKTDVNYMRVGINMVNDYLKLFNFRFGYGVSDIRQIMNVFNEYYNQLLPKPDLRERSLIEELVNALNIKPLPVEPFEGYIFSDSKYETQFYPFDKNSFERDISRTITNISRALNEDFSVNTMYNHDEVLGFPTETGLPFVHTIQTPIVQKFIPKNPKISIDKDIDLKTSIQMLFTSRVQNRWGFTVPFELQQYTAGVDRDFYTYLPAKVEVKKQFDRDQIQLQIGVDPALLQKNQQDYSLMHFSTVPFVIRHDVLDLEPLSRNNKIHDKIQETSKRNKFQLGIFEILIQGHRKMIETPNLNNIVKLFSAGQEDNRYKKIDVSVSTAVKPVQLTIAHAKNNIDTPTLQIEIEKDLEKFAVNDKQPNSEARRKQFLAEVSKGLQSSHNHVWDIDVGYPTNTSQKRSHQVFTIGVGHSNADKRYHTIFYWNIQPGTSENVDYEICGNGRMALSRETPLDLQRMLDSEQRDTFEYVLQYGKNYIDGRKVNIVGNTSQSSDLKNMLRNNKIIKECLRDLKYNKESQACQKGSHLAQIKDRVNFSVATNSDSDSIVIEILFNVFSHIYSKIAKIIKPRENRKNSIDVEVKMSQDRDQADVFVSSFDKDISLTLSSYSNIPSLTLMPSTLTWESWLSEVSRWASKLSWPLPLEAAQHLATGLLSSRWLERIQSLWNPSWKLLSLEKQIDYMSKYAEKPSICNVGKRQITTFDSKTYPMYGEKYWQVLVIPIPPNEETIPEEERMSILSREKNGQKELRFILNYKQIDIRRTNDGIQISIDGQPAKQYNTHDRPNNTSYQIRDNDNVDLEIYELPDKSIEIKSCTRGVDAIYNGETIAIRVADQYANEIRGLCGNYDSRPDNDFLSPQNCVAQKPEHFHAMYTLMEGSHERWIAINKDKQYPCVPETNYPNNVVSDIEAGRPPLDWSPYSRKASRKEIKDPQTETPFIYRTQIEERDDNICFSTRPIPVCQGSLPDPNKRKMKIIEFFCLPRNEASEQLKLRVKNGANPDFSQKPVSFKKPYEVPLTCRAA
ncbi:Vitellogenin [Camponotus floridanus]|uniref:Vitellogenin n=1 Tax=Camponotus floridanus TaxID=104421 RepID=E2ANT2_CAMFO|nr:vitellogenin-1 [Camponotus floridanus]EFN64902.1 Vitellogenin [Camponotus floridanus]